MESYIACWLLNVFISIYTIFCTGPSISSKFFVIRLHMHMSLACVCVHGLTGGVNCRIVILWCLSLMCWHERVCSSLWWALHDLYSYGIFANVFHIFLYIHVLPFLLIVLLRHVDCSRAYYEKTQDWIFDKASINKKMVSE